MCYLFTLKSMHSFSLGIQKMVMECTPIYISSAAAATGHRTSLLRACNLLQTVIRKHIGSENINVDVSKGDISAEMNRLQTNNGISSTIEVR